MSICFDEQNQLFSVSTAHTSYLMGVFAQDHLLHLYYGPKISGPGAKELFPYRQTPERLRWLQRDAEGFFNSAPFEYPAAGTGDFRDVCLCVRDERGSRVCQLKYAGYEILGGTQNLPGLPAVFGENAQTLRIDLKDELLGLEVSLRYTVFEDSDAIIKSVALTNRGEGKLYLEKALSSCLTLDFDGQNLTTLHGNWGRERHILTRAVSEGKFCVGSVCGKTSHIQQPFMMLTGKNSSQTAGDVYGMNLIYSGNFLAETECDYQYSLRMSLGIHPEGFTWVLSPGETFHTPQAVLVYSAGGIAGMTHTFHDLYRNHLIRSPWLHQKRPILINNWEATYFDFNSDKLVSIAEEAAKAGIELLVMDDGWFGKRNDDNSSLGDWFVNEEKLPGGLKPLADRINALGLKFGIWMEPEMISPDSDLYRAHPDWAIHVPGRTPTLSRNQCVLDMTRADVRAYIYGRIRAVLQSANIAYVKWDMNRCLTDVASATLDAAHMGEFFHRYVLGVYELQERLITDFPDLLLENCTGGGGRFDPGMLYYSPQIWCSDNMDPIERLAIQEGTALVYPMSTMGAHICVCPNHSVGRTTPLHTRANVAMAGTFGYELDITKLSGEEKAQIAQFNRRYHELNHIVRDGDYHRIASWRENGRYDCWQCVSKDRSECIVTFVQVRYETVSRAVRLKLQGLDPDRNYRLEGTDRIFSGSTLMHAGYQQEQLFGEYDSCILHFTSIQ